MRKSNSLMAQDPDVEPGEISRSTEVALMLGNLPPIDKKDNVQIKNRIDEYFRLCVQNDKRPLIMGLCLALGVSRVTLIDWEREETERGRIIRQAKGVIRYLIESWTTEGKLSPPVGIFWSKNLLGFTDSVTVQAMAVSNPDTTPVKTPEQIALEIAEDIPIDVYQADD